MVSKLARGRVSKFLLVSSNRMLVVKVTIIKLRFFLMDLLFTLRIARLNPPQVFYRFSFLGLSYRCVFYFPLLYIDMIYLC